MHDAAYMHHYTSYVYILKFVDCIWLKQCSYTHKHTHMFVKKYINCMDSVMKRHCIIGFMT